MSDWKLDLLAIGPHPDDVELFCGGTVIAMGQRGHRTGILDLTEGEMASNGSVEERRREAAAAATVMGAELRENLGLPDTGLSPMSADVPQRQYVLRLVAALRRLRPEVVLAPWIEARHPDHSAAGQLVTEAIFAAGLAKIVTGALTPIRPRRLLYYQMRHRFTPSFVVDISSVADRKLQAIHCHASQFGTAKTGVPTLIGSSNAIAAIEARDRHYGTMIGVGQAEPFFVRETMGLADPIDHFRSHHFGPAHFFEALP